jgi:5-methylcytosine-specific restriction endonuclease McrA
MATGSISLTKIAHQCACCGESFFPKRTDRLKFCSRACAFRAKAEGKRTAALVRRHRVLTLHRHCEECSKAFTVGNGNRSICSPECSASRARRAARDRNMAIVGVKQFQCVECGTVFSPAYGDKSRAYCSGECARKVARRNRPRGSDRKRARAYGVEYEYVNPLKVLRRDNWTCQLCGRKTPLELRGTLNPRAPEVDHILPISKGGAHTYANLQCACRACNMAKGATPKGQHQLFAA